MPERFPGLHNTEDLSSDIIKIKIQIRTKKHVRNAHSIINAQRKNIAKSDSNQNSVESKLKDGKHQMSQPKKL